MIQALSPTVLKILLQGNSDKKIPFFYIVIPKSFNIMKKSLDIIIFINHLESFCSNE